MLKDRVRLPVRLLLVGINPGVRSEALGHHFAGHSNRFWKLLFQSGLVSEALAADEDHRLPEWGHGITNLVPRCTPGIDGLRPAEYAAGERALRRKVRRWRPEVVAFLGVTLFRAVFPAGGASPAAGRRRGRISRISLGLQAERFEGARVFVLPNPSGRNANYSYHEMLAAFRLLRRYLQPRRSQLTQRTLQRKVKGL
jgi:TDG/mug DNA glycosylase family protein